MVAHPTLFAWVLGCTSDSFCPDARDKTSRDCTGIALGMVGNGWEWLGMVGNGWNLLGVIGSTLEVFGGGCTSDTFRPGARDNVIHF